MANKSKKIEYIHFLIPMHTSIIKFIVNFKTFSNSFDTSMIQMLLIEGWFVLSCFIFLHDFSF